MKYYISLKNPLTHFFTVRLVLDNIDRERIMLQLPIWRPGRYEATHYAKNIRGLQVHDGAGKALDYEKLNPDAWSIATKDNNYVEVIYDYFAFKMDAGNSLYDEDQVYINFINCLLYDPEKIDEQCSVTYDFPDHYTIASGLHQQGNQLIASDYYDLVDSPLVAAPELEHYTYDVDHTEFHIWLNGRHSLDIQQLLIDFKKFCRTQISIMGEFPERTYHFLLQITPYKFYHGVEHHDSTVICLGPGENLHSPEMYTQLLGVSSHELFHAWNIIRIRPQELMPYQFNKDVFFPTGFVAEGFTTYYGDLFLARSGVFDRPAFFKELNTLFKRHFSNFGRLNYSLVDSSLDLWIDGYTNNTPERKSSIYVEGAMVALCLDLMIRKKTNNNKSLDDVMRSMWTAYGKTGIGYTYENVQQCSEAVYGESLETFFSEHVKGIAPKNHIINEALGHVGCHLIQKEADNNLEKYFGIKVLEANGNVKVIQIAPDSIGEQHFSLNDELIRINGQKADLNIINQYGTENYEFQVKRNFKELTVKLEPGKERYLQQYIIEPLADPSGAQHEAFRQWSGCELV